MMEVNWDKLEYILNDRNHYGARISESPVKYIVLELKNRQSEWLKQESRQAKIDYNWKEAYAKAFRDYYKLIISDELIESSIQWNVEFISRFVKEDEPLTKLPLITVTLNLETGEVLTDGNPEVEKWVQDKIHSKLVPLDEDKLIILLKEVLGNNTYSNVAKAIYSKFGQPLAALNQPEAKQ